MLLVNVPVTFQPQLNLNAPLPRLATVCQAQTSSLIDAQIQLQTQPTRLDENLFDVLVEENFTVDVPVQLLQTCGVPFSSTVLGKRPHEEDNDILLDSHGTFHASASTSSIGKKPRMSRSRRVSFTPITLPKSPKVRAVLRAFETALKRAMRDQNRVIDPVLHLTASDALRQRKSCASRTIEQRILARSINTQQHRNSGSRLDVRPASNAQQFRKAVHELEWGWCLECNERFPDTSAREICNFCKKDREKHPEGSLFSASNSMDPGKVPIEL
ncbi:hypothetical protein MKX01_040958 [Papaver californicum]|nr:hypothetical protein MKX01_040958 [Papaver californicum]